MKLTPIHPKVKATGGVGVLATAVVELLDAFGVDLSVAAVAPIITIVLVLAGYLKPANTPPVVGGG